MTRVSKIFKFILLCVAFGLFFLVLKRTIDNVNEQMLKEKECVNTRVEINGGFNSC